MQIAQLQEHAQKVAPYGAELYATLAVARLTPGRGRSPGGHLPVTEDAKQALGEAVEIALELGHNYVGTEHLLLALMRVPEGTAAQVLTGLGVTYDRAKETVVAMLVGYQHKSKR